MNRIEKIRANLAQRKGSYERDNSVFPFWNLAFNSSATLRLLPYNDPTTGNFWTEKVMVPMMFVDPDDEGKTIFYKAPCREMYVPGNPKDLCPILVPVRALYKEAEELKNTGQDTESKRLVKIAGLHWKKLTFYYQGFIIKPGFTESEEIPENPIRVFPFAKQIHKIIEASLDSKDDTFDFLPTGDFTEDDLAALTGDVDETELERIVQKFEGFNFIVHKTKQGEHAHWSVGTGWARNSKVMLTEDQILALSERGYHDLSKRLPERPSEEKYAVLREMMDVSLDRLLHGGDGYWNKEWEEVGIKPTTTGKKVEGSEESKNTPNTKITSSSKLKERLSKSSNDRTTNNALDNIRKRGIKTEDSTDDKGADTPSTSEAVKAPPTNVKALAAKIKSRISQEA